MSRIGTALSVDPSRDRNARPAAVGHGPGRVLVVGDDTGQVCRALGEVIPVSRTLPVTGVFDAIAELHQGDVGAVVMNVTPIARRGEPAIKAIRQGLDAHGSGGRIVLFGPSQHESLCRRILSAGAEEGDGFVATPPDPQALLRAIMPEPATVQDDPPASLDGLDLAAAAVAALLDTPGKAADTFARTAGLRDHTDPRVSALLSKLDAADTQRQQWQQMALTDGLSGCYNVRYFRRYLDKLLAKARRERFPVTLLLFDIDNFKQYNDAYGHAVGDRILRQTAEVIKRCIREHDLVARIGGDEFAVVFWEKDGPRTPLEKDNVATPPSAARFPQGPVAIAERFRRLVSAPEFSALGPSGEGSLSVSGGMAVFPFDAQTTEELIEAADKALLFTAKRGGKDSIALVGE